MRPGGSTTTEPVAAATQAVVASENSRRATSVNLMLKKFAACEGRVAPPRASPSWGVVELLSSIQLRSESPSDTIFYALDGFPGTRVDDPGTVEYAGPIQLLHSGHVTLRALTVSPSGKRSGVVQLQYFVVLPSSH